MRYLYMMNIYNEIGAVSMVEHLTLTEREIIHILRRNDEQFAKKLIIRAVNMEKVMHKEVEK